MYRIKAAAASMDIFDILARKGDIVERGRWARLENCGFIKNTCVIKLQERQYCQSITSGRQAGAADPNLYA